MAPKAEIYFPPLEKCLAGGSILTSWPEALTRLCDKRPLHENEKIYKFLSTEEGIRSLAACLKDADPPTSQSKSDFETRTAAINITPASHGQYDIDQIKSDALWLSQEVNLNEVSALRIVVVEWQNRPKTRLRHGFTEAERATLEAVIGGSGIRGLGHSGRELRTIFTRDTSDSSATRFLSDERRKLRILDEFFGQRRALYAVHERLLASCLGGLDEKHEDLLSWSSQSPKSPDSPIESLGRMVLRAQKDLQGSAQQVDLCVRRLRVSVDKLASGSGIFKSEGGREDIEDAWTRVNLHEMISVLNIMFLHIRSCKKIFTASTILEWLRFAGQYDFLERFEPTSDAQFALIPALRASVVSVSLAILQLQVSLNLLVELSGKSREELEPRHLSAYFLDKSNVLEIHEILLTAGANGIPVASPAVFAWGVLLYAVRDIGISTKEVRESNHLLKGPDTITHGGPQTIRRNSGSSIGSMQQSIYEDIIDAIRQVHQEDPVGLFFSSAVESSNVFEIISTAATIPGSKESVTATEKSISFQELISASLDIVGYSPEVVSTLLELLGDSSFLSGSLQQAAATAFMRDKILVEAVFAESLSRFPYESLPFLKLCAGLSSVRDELGVPLVLSRMSSIDTFTQATGSDFHGFHTIREDENANFVTLDQALSMHRLPGRLFIEGPVFSAKSANQEDDFLISAGTTGQVISDSRPPVVMWYHRYSALNFLGKMLDLIRRGDDVPFADNDGSTSAIVAATITLLTRLMSSSLEGQSIKGRSAALDLAKSILEDASDSLQRNKDIVSLVFEIFEQELQGIRYRSASDRNLDVLIACVEFFERTIQVLPGRIWPLLAQSSLLDLDGSGGLLGSVVASIEAASGYYFFLQSCVHLYSALIEEAIALPTSILSETTSRSSGKHSLSSAAPMHVVGNVLLSMTRSMIQLLEIASDWRFMIPQQQAESTAELYTAFSKILRYAYFVDDSSVMPKQLATALSTCAPSIIDALKPLSATGTLTNPILRVLAGGLQLPDPTLDPSFFDARVAEVERSLSFSLDAVKAGRYLKTPLVGLESQLVHTLPCLIRLVAEHEQFVTPTTCLIDCLLQVDSSATSSGSLLGHLGAESSQNFLALFGQYNLPEEDLDAYCASWQLLSTLVSSHQQWFAVFILTGCSPKDTVKAKPRGRGDSGTANGKSFLDTALHALYHIESLKPRAALVLLTFAAQAQENWSWATTSIRNQSGFLPSLYNYVAKIDLKPNRPLEHSYQIKAAAVIADILTIHFHHMRSVGETSFLKKAIPSIIWYTENAVNVSGFNASLHSNLKKNLERKYPTCQLSTFRKTSAASRRLGEDYYYDVDIAKAMLSHDAIWIGDRERGFEHELIRANINLSLVDAQLSLLHSWRTLAVEHGSFFLKDSELQQPIASAANKTLHANTISYPQEAIFDTVFQIRLDLALALLQRMNSSQASGGEVKTLLSNAWEAMRFREPNFENALANEDLVYWRSMSEILFLTLQFHTRAEPEEDGSKLPSLKSNTLSILLEILTVIVGQGFRGLTSVLHDETIPAETVTAKDFGLLLGILQTCLRIPYVPRISAEISEHLISIDVAKSAILLFSWSHTLVAPAGAASDPDPIYGEISLLFIVSLSTMPLLAEYLAASSVLSQLSSTHLAHILSVRQRAVSPFDTKSSLTRRLYSIWSTGILPLALNLLSHVGRNFASEIAAFLNQFPAQLSRAASYISSSESIALTTTNELFSLALITFVLDAYRAAGSSAGVDALEIPDLVDWDTKGRKELKEDIEDLLQRRAGLRKRIVPINAKETEWLWAKPTKQGQGYENLLEEKVVEELNGVLSVLNGGEES